MHFRRLRSYDIARHAVRATGPSLRLQEHVSRAIGPVTSTMTMFALLVLIGEAVAEPSGRVFNRLVVVTWMAALLLALGCVLG